ncbi:MAG: protein TolA [Halothiobacillus sp. 13-55-253]|nr:MAG: protein TolA [Halothiobacillus sp. 13-55-253]
MRAAAAKERATAAAAKQAAAEAAAQAEQAKKQAAAEKAAAEKAAKEQAAKEKAAKAAADKAAKEKAAKLAAQKAAQARKAALQQQLQEELRQGQAKQVQDAWIGAITQKVRNQWYKPPGWQPNWTCTVHISQARDGTVLNVKIGQCDGDQLFQRSVQQAVERASPLPLPADMSLFQSSFTFTFVADPHG